MQGMQAGKRNKVGIETSPFWLVYNPFRSPFQVTWNIEQTAKKNKQTTTIIIMTTTITMWLVH
jgi:hypothetical protein